MKYRKLRYEIRSLRRGVPIRLRQRNNGLLLTLFSPQHYRIIACSFFALMIFIGSIPGEAQALSDAFGDKLLHLCAYSFLTCVLFGSLYATGANRFWKTVLLIALLGALDEAIQSLLPYRNANLTDWTVNMMASGLTLTMICAVNHTWRRMDQSSP